MRFSLGETSFQLSNAEEMRHKLVKLFKQAESLSASILNYGNEDSDQPSTPTAKQPNQQQQKQKPSLDQLKLQRNIRYFVINYLRENSFNLAQLPSGDEYAVLVKQRERFMIEEARRNEAELARQRRQINERLAATAGASGGSGTAGSFGRSAAVKFNKNNTVTIDNSNGWIASQSARKDELELGDDGSMGGGAGGSNGTPDAEALRIQIQLVEGYIEDALKANRSEEAQLLKANLNELLTCLANLD